MIDYKSAHTGEEIDEAVGKVLGAAPIPVEKGGTGAASAADARTALNVPSTEEMNTAVNNATKNLVTTTAMNTAINGAVGNINTILDEINGEVV